MRLTSIVAIGVTAGLSAATARADTPVGYRLVAGSQLTERFCVGPCACPYHESQGPVSGTFTLTRTQPGPLFDRYIITGFRGIAAIGGINLTVEGFGTYTRGGEFAMMQELILDLTIDGQPWHFDSGVVPIDPQHPFPQIFISAETDVVVCRQDALDLAATPDPAVCYANCDGSTALPRLNINDFLCFQSAFAAGSPYANCDGSTESPILNVNDFLCFQARFAEGCP